MRMIQATMFAAVIAVGFAGALHADASEDLLKVTHEGEKESKVADNWWDSLPTWASSLTSKNTFPQTHLPFEFRGDKLDKMREGVNKFEIRDANKRQFQVFLMIRNGVDGRGLPRYSVSQKSGWVSWKSWPATYIVETYPVESNQDDNSVVGFGAWLYDEKEEHLANRVLTVVHQRNKKLAPLIESYICEKQDWQLPPEGLKVWNIWDKEYQTERHILVTPEVYQEKLKEREEAAQEAFESILDARGDYKGRPPRRNPPTKQLVWIEWEIKQFKRNYGASDFAKKDSTTATLQDILDSIKDDLAVLKDNLQKVDDIVKNPNDPNQLEKKAEFLEELLKFDPMDINLRSKVGNAWYEWGNPHPSGNGCDRYKGMKKAVPHYEAILEAYPNSVPFLMAIGRCWQAMENSDDARPYYEKVIDLEGDEGHGRVAAALIRNMENKDAERAGKTRR